MMVIEWSHMPSFERNLSDKLQDLCDVYSAWSVYDQYRDEAQEHNCSYINATLNDDSFQWEQLLEEEEEEVEADELFVCASPITGSLIFEYLDIDPDQLSGWILHLCILAVVVRVLAVLLLYAKNKNAKSWILNKIRKTGRQCLMYCIGNKMENTNSNLAESELKVHISNSNVKKSSVNSLSINGEQVQMVDIETSKM